jgi:hypothetical protein
MKLLGVFLSLLAVVNLVAAQSGPGGGTGDGGSGGGSTGPGGGPDDGGSSGPGGGPDDGSSGPGGGGGDGGDDPGSGGGEDPGSGGEDTSGPSVLRGRDSGPGGGGGRIKDFTLNIVNAALSPDGFTRSKLNLFFTMCVMLIFPSGTVVAEGT